MNCAFSSVQFLLECRASVDEGGSVEENAVRSNAVGGDTDTIKYILEHGGKATVSALHDCAYSDNAAVASVLVQKLTDTNTDLNVNLDMKVQGFTLLHACAIQNALAVAKLILDAGADTETRGVKFNMEMLAAAIGGEQIIDLQFTPLHVAAFFSSAEVVQVLLEKKASHDCKPKPSLNKYPIAVEWCQFLPAPFGPVLGKLFATPLELAKMNNASSRTISLLEAASKKAVKAQAAKRKQEEPRAHRDLEEPFLSATLPSVAASSRS